MTTTMPIQKTPRPPTAVMQNQVNRVTRDDGIKPLSQGTEGYKKTNALINEARSVLQDRPGTDPDVIQVGVVVDSPVGRILFIVLNPKKVTSVAPYENKDLLKVLAARLKFPVYWSNHVGFRYAVHMQARGKGMPKEYKYSGWQAGRVILGMGLTGLAFATSWAEFGHGIIAGITQYGKSNALRVIFTQAVSEGHTIYLGNFASNTWNPLIDVQHAQIKNLVNTPEEYLDLINELLEERDRRQKLFAECPGHPDNIDEYNHHSSQSQHLPRIVAFLDEFSAAIENQGGARSELSMRTVELLKTALKYGIQLVLAGQDFYVSDIGHLVNHCSTRICLRVNNPHLSKALVGVTGAEKFKIQGRALTNKWNVVQIALITKEQMLQSLISRSTGMNAREESLARALWSYETQPGWMDIERIRQHTGLSQDKARELRADMVRRGLAKHFPDKNNGIYLTVKP